MDNLPNVDINTVLQDEEYDGPVEIKKLKQRVMVDEPYSEACQWDEDAVTLSLPSSIDIEAKNSLDKTPNINLVDNAASRKWADVLKEGLDFNTYGDAFLSSFSNPDSMFKQHVEYGGQKYRPQAPKVKNTENENLKGERAVLRVIRQLGLGTTFQVPLWHSGIWVTFKPPTEAEIIELNRQLVSEKIRMGRYTYGLAYSNITSYTVDYLMDFAISHIYTTTVKNDELPISNIRNHIAVQDLFALFWGLACTMYPKGFQYRRSCISNPEKCNHVLEEKINLSKLLLVNNNALTEWQKSHMAMRQPFQRDLSAVKKYQDEMLGLKSRSINLSNSTDGSDLKITLRSPLVNQYIDEGHRWISGIVDVINSSLSNTARDDERNILVERYAQASSMRQYVHWVESIEIDSNIIDDRETIEMTLNVMSADDKIREHFLSEVVNYINESTMAIVGIPVHDCPACGEEQKDTVVNSEFTNVIPLDVIQLFFVLTTQRVLKISSR